MSHRYTSVALSLLLLFGLLSGCGEKENPAESGEFGEISGTVTLVGTWPETGDVQVSAWTTLRDGQPYMVPGAKTEPLDAPDGGTVDYALIGVSKGTYLAVTLGWRDPANPMGGKVLGVHWAKADSVGVDSQGKIAVTPSPIEVSAAKMVWTDIDMKANLDIAP